MKYSYLLLILGAMLFFQCENKVNKREIDNFAQIDSVIQEIESELTPLENEIGRLATYTTYLYENQNEFVGKADKGKFAVSDSGVFYNPSPQEEESAVYISTLTTNRQEAIRQAYFTEDQDSLFSRLVNENPIVSQVFFNTKNQFSRVYPNYSVLTMVEPDLDLTTFNFYYMGDEVRNPQKGPKWLEEVYIDPVGRGWVLSLIHPVYHKNKLQGVLGFDITVNNLVGNFLDKSAKNFVIVDSGGTIIAGKANAIESLDMPPLKNHTYIQTINSDNFPVEDFNLFKSKNKEVRRMVSRFLLEKDNSFELSLDGKTNQVYCKRLNILNWYIIDINNL
ncbi:PDC sensor domain-containing protein [Litoribacter populi]|uniref:PDC sensor domain-containing protein n=1 Tax=Litoribacter populi TaxID=2598460 RepID=UPI0011808D77|nr:cache domain-containing protein [Litoribacter populi]